MNSRTNGKKPSKRNTPKPPDPASLPPLDLNRRYDALLASAYLSQCLATTRKQISDGTLESFTVGRRRYIPGRAIQAASVGPAATAATSD